MKARHFLLFLKVLAPRTYNKEDSNKKTNYISKILIDFLTLFAIKAGVRELLAAVASTSHTNCLFSLCYKAIALASYAANLSAYV
jgi:hypothetical protein